MNSHFTRRGGSWSAAMALALVLATAVAAQEQAPSERVPSPETMPVPAGRERVPSPETMPVPGATMPERWLPVDENGWTILKPSADSRIVYVSSGDGDDATAQVYHTGHEAVGADPTKPTVGIRPFKTIAAAMAKMRDRHPDWLLLERGGEWVGQGISVLSGRSKAEPAVIAAWGAAPARPLLRGRNASVSLRGVNHVVVAGLDLYADYMDPASPEYGLDGKGGTGVSIGSGPRGSMENVLVEDCRLRFAGMSCGGATLMANVVIRRCLVLDKYPVKGHTMGFWGSHGSILLEECVFDHNGWLHQNVESNKGKPGLANNRSHNTYMTQMYSTIFRDNIFARGASMGNKFTANYGPGSTRHIVLENNLYVDGEIGISMGGNNPGPLRWLDCAVLNNVMLDIGLSRPTGRSLGWYLDVQDWDGGRIAGNLFLHQRSERVSNVYGIHVTTSKAKVGRPPWWHQGPAGRARNVVVERNVMHGLRSNGHVFRFSGSERMENILIRGNQIQMPGLETRLVSLSGEDRKGVRFEANTYYSEAATNTWFSVKGTDLGFDDWVKQSGETGATLEKVEYPDDTRNIQNYMKHLGLEPTHEAFIREIRKQSRSNWRKEFTAAAINDWIRAGFGAEPVPAFQEELVSE